MNEVTYRTRASGPGWTAQEIRARLLQIAGGSIVKALEFACHDIELLTTGGFLRPPLKDGKPAEIVMDEVEPAS